MGQRIKFVPVSPVPSLSNFCLGLYIKCILNYLEMKKKEDALGMESKERAGSKSMNIHRTHTYLSVYESANLLWALALHQQVVIPPTGYRCIHSFVPCAALPPPPFPSPTLETALQGKQACSCDDRGRSRPGASLEPGGKEKGPWDQREDRSV